MFYIQVAATSTAMHIRSLNVPYSFGGLGLAGAISVP